MLICLKLRAGRTTIQRDRDMLRYVIVSYSFVRQSEKKYVLLVWYCFLCIFQKIAFLAFEAQNVSWTRKSISESEWALLASYVYTYKELFIVTEAPQCNRMIVTGQDTDNKITRYKYAMYKMAKTQYRQLCEVWHVHIWNEEISMCGE